MAVENKHNGLRPANLNFWTGLANLLHCCFQQKFIFQKFSLNLCCVPVTQVTVTVGKDEDNPTYTTLSLCDLPLTRTERIAPLRFSNARDLLELSSLSSDLPLLSIAR